MFKISIVLLSTLFLMPQAFAKSAQSSKARVQAVDTIVLHAIGGPYCANGLVRNSPAKGDARQWFEFFNSHRVLSIHYIVDREGVVLSHVPEHKIANHTLGWNGRSIGIELVNNGDHLDEYSVQQIRSLKILVQGVLSRHPHLTKDRVFRHSDLDKSVLKCAAVEYKRKQDPGARFDYQGFIRSLDR
ncbi:N-acetylmuramoyl-L-alanine amidase [Gammaproteobacteria bacterium AS21]